MRRLGNVLLMVIALVTGITAGTIFGRPGAPVAYPGLAGSSDTAHAFYDALNQTLAGSSADALAALLAPGYLDHDASIGEVQTAEEFLERLRLLGQTPGSTRLSVESIEASGNSLIVQVIQAELGPHALAGISVEQRVGQPIFEVLRVVRDHIIDRWTPGVWWLQATEFEDVVLRAYGLTDIATTLVRVDIPAGGGHRWYAVETGFLFIESGSARMQAIHFNGDEETHELTRGAAASVTAGDRVQLRSVDGEPVTALVYAMVRRGAAEVILTAGAWDAQGNGVTQSILWSGPLPHSDESTVHRLGILVLPIGEEIRLTSVANATLVVSIDSDAIEIAAPGGAVSILGVDLSPVEHLNFAGIDARRAASITGASAITLRNVSQLPVAIVLVVIKNDAQGGPPIG